MKILPLKKNICKRMRIWRSMRRRDTKDPSDHVIIAHAITEHLPLISSDTRFGFYKVKGWTCYSIRNNLYIVYVRMAFVRVVEVKYSKTLSAYFYFIRSLQEKLGGVVLCTHLLNLFNVNK